MGTLSRPKNRSSVGAAVLASMLMLAACTSDDPDTQIATEAESETSMVAPSTSTPSTLASSAVTADPSEDADVEPGSDYLCGDEFPVFLDDWDSSGPDTTGGPNIDGTPGPGLGGLPASEGQMVSHWVKDFGTTELRWPSDEAPEALDAEGLIDSFYAGFPAALDLSDPLLLKVHLRIDGWGTPCSTLTASVYGADPHDLLAGTMDIAAMLRPRSEASALLELIELLASDDGQGSNRPEGECAVPVESSQTGGEVTAEDSVELVRRYLSDRASGARAQDCLTRSGLVSAHDSRHSRAEASCLFTCEQGPSPLLEPLPIPVASEHAPKYVEAMVMRTNEDRYVDSVHESYVVITRERADGSSVLLIDSATSGLDTDVAYDWGFEFLTNFYKDLADARFEDACCIFNEGVSKRIVEQLGLGPDGESDVPLAESYRRYCETAYCSDPFEILYDTPGSDWQRIYVVQFMTDDGPIEQVVGVGSFEGQLTIDSMPPAWTD